MSVECEKPLVWVIDSPRTPLAKSFYAFEACSRTVYFIAGQPLPIREFRPDAIVISAEIEGGPYGEVFRELLTSLPGVPVLAAARVRSLAQAVAFFRNGVSDYLSLPLDADEVAERLAAILASGSVANGPVMLEIEPLDGDDAESLSLSVVDNAAEEDGEEDILARLPVDDETPLPVAELVEPAGDGEEPEPVDGLFIPALWDELPCGLVVFDSQGNLVFANSLAMELFGQTNLAELQDALENRRPSFQAIGTNRKPFPDNQWPHSAAVRARTARHAAVSLLRRDGSRVWVRMDCLPHLSEGSVARLIVTLINMTGEIPEPPVAAPAPKRKTARRRRP